MDKKYVKGKFVLITSISIGFLSINAINQIILFKMIKNTHSNNNYQMINKTIFKIEKLSKNKIIHRNNYINQVDQMEEIGENLENLIKKKMIF